MKRTTCRQNYFLPYTFSAYNIKKSYSFCNPLSSYKAAFRFRFNKKIQFN